MNVKRSLLRNWLSLLGIVASVGALFAFILLFTVDLFSGHATPFFGLLAYVCMPAVFAGGVALLVIGLLIQYWWDNHLPVGESKCPCAYLKMKMPDPNVDFSRLSTWGVALTILVILGVSAGVLTAAGFKVYHWSESDEFCGELCHTPMKPENVAHQDSPHAKIKCVECHVGPGIDAYAYAKINGIRQLAQELTGTYHTPIHVPVKAMYGRHLDGKTKIEHTCMECHWENQYVGFKAKQYTHFLKNEEDIKVTYGMTLNIGGSNPERGPVGGIHWHAAPGNKVEFVTENNKREGAVSWIRVTTQSGTTNHFAKSDFKFDPAKQNVFTMTCLDCHNRPAHQYASPVTAVDLAMEIGTLPTELGDSVKLNVIELLTASYETEAEAMKAIADGMTEYYEGSEHLEQSIKTVQNIFKRNIFPEMKASWAAYPNHLGHKESIGCARCHNDSLVNDAETSVPTDCKTCHLIISQFKDGEWDESDVKGLDFQHPDGSDQTDISTCSRCHDGTF